MFLTYMRGDLISLLIQVTGLLLTIQYAIYRPKKAEAVPVGIFIMLCANVGGQICFAGEGPGAAVGFIALPIYGVIATLITVKIVNSNKLKHTNKN